MTLSDLLALAHQIIRFEERAKTHPMVSPYHPETGAFARAISDLLSGPGDECGFERPVVRAIMLDDLSGTAPMIAVPDSWCDEYVSPADAEAMARMLLRAAEMAREGK